MAYAPIAYISPQYNSEDYANWWLKAYSPRTTTPKLMSLTKDGAVTVAKLELNEDGFINTAGDAIVIPYIDGLYDLWLFPTEAEADANDTSNAIKLAEDVQADLDGTPTIYVKTVAEMQQIENLNTDMTVRVAERADALFQVTDFYGVINPYNVIASATDGNFVFVLRIEPNKALDLRKIGRLGEGNDLAIAQAGIDLGSILIAQDVDFDDRLLITNPNRYIFIAENTTVTVSGWAYPGGQLPFGQQFHFTAENCGVVGGGDSSLIQAGITDATIVGFLHCDGGFLANFKIDGNKSNNHAITDDTFQNGVNIVNHSASNPSGVGGFHFSNLTIQNCTQYGMNIWGDRAINISVDGCRIHSNGNASEPESVGSAIVCTVAVSDISITNNKLYNNKTRGLYLSSAGSDAKDYTITGNQIYGNGLHGVSITEESNLGSGVGQGISGIALTGNTIRDNASHGVLIGTYDSVGYVNDVQVTGNTITGNGGYGFLVQTNNHATDRTSDIVVGLNNINNNDYGIGVGTNIDETVKFSANNTNNNATANISNSGAPAGIETSFTPGVQGTTAAGTATYATQDGSYTLIDDRVIYSLVIDYSAFTGTGNMQITGLPHTVSGSAPVSPASAWVNGITLTGQAFLVPLNGSTVANLDAINNGALSPVAVDAAGAIRVSGEYFIDN